MKCCGAERTTPYCPSCGKQIMKPSPLVEILCEEREVLEREKKRLETSIREKNATGYTSRIKEEVQRRERRVEALEEGMTNLGQPAKVMSDWLKENGYEEAGKTLLGAFTGVPS